MTTTTTTATRESRTTATTTLMDLDQINQYREINQAPSKTQMPPQNHSRSPSTSPLAPAASPKTPPRPLSPSAQNNAPNDDDDDDDGPSNLRAVARLAGLLFGNMYAEQEHPSPETLQREQAEAEAHMERRRIRNSAWARAEDRVRARARARSIVEWREKQAQFARDVDLLRPTHWDDAVHTAFFMTTWGSLVKSWERAHPGVEKITGENFGEIIDLLHEAKDALRVEFPVLGQGEVRVRALWLEWVLSREGVPAFCDEEGRRQVEELVRVEAGRVRGQEGRE